MVADRGFIGVLLLAVGAALALPEVFVIVPAPGLFAVGLFAAVVGGVLLCDGERRS